MGRQQQPAPVPSGLMGLPTYDQAVPEGMQPSVEEEEEEEEVMDENERVALQEAEDERIAREMMQREDDEVSWHVVGGKEEGEKEMKRKEMI